MTIIVRTFTVRVHGSPIVGPIIGPVIRTIVGPVIRAVIRSVIRSVVGSIIGAVIGSIIRTIVGAVIGPVVVAVVARVIIRGIERIGASVDLGAIIDATAIGVGLEGIGHVNIDLLTIGEAIAISVSVVISGTSGGYFESLHRSLQ